MEEDDDETRMMTRSRKRAPAGRILEMMVELLEICCHAGVLYNMNPPWHLFGREQSC
jgi:hypothetical protein